MAEQERELLVYPAGQVLVDAVVNTAKDVSGTALYTSATRKTITAIEDDSGEFLPAVQRFMLYAGGVVLTQLAPAYAATVADIGENGTTRENLIATIPAVVADIATAIPRFSRIGHPLEYEAMTVGYIGAVEFVRNLYGQIAFKGNDIRRYPLPTKSMRRTGEMLSRAMSTIVEMGRKIGRR